MTLPHKGFTGSISTVCQCLKKTVFQARSKKKDQADGHDRHAGGQAVQ